jgi:sec-independent protein translocase protein TatA
MPLLAGVGPFGPLELGLILLIVVLIFGVGRLPEVGGAVGRSIREFRKATKEEEQHVNQSAAPPESGSAPSESAPESTTIFCSECGTRNARTAKFCSNCGSSIKSAVN